MTLEEFQKAGSAIRPGPRDPMGNLLATPRMGIRFAKSLA
jgi:hypothetical protein